MQSGRWEMDSANVHHFSGVIGRIWVIDAKVQDIYGRNGQMGRLEPTILYHRSIFDFKEVPRAEMLYIGRID